MGKGRSIRGIQGLVLFFGLFLAVLGFVASVQGFERVEEAAQLPKDDPARHAKFTGTIVHYVILGQGRGQDIHVGILDDGKGEDQWYVKSDRGTVKCSFGKRWTENSSQGCVGDSLNNAGKMDPSEYIALYPITSGNSEITGWRVEFQGEDVAKIMPPAGVRYGVSWSTAHFNW